jgi:hypothetical protein
MLHRPDDIWPRLSSSIPGHSACLLSARDYQTKTSRVTVFHRASNQRLK